MPDKISVHVDFDIYLKLFKSKQRTYSLERFCVNQANNTLSCLAGISGHTARQTLAVGRSPLGQ